MHKQSNYNLAFRLCAGALILLHLVTFGPIRDAFAFSAQSDNYRLTSGILNNNGLVSYTKLLMHAEGADGASAFSDSSGKTVINAANYDSDTKLISHFDGAGGSTSYLDARGGSYTFRGSAQLDTEQKKFGSASLKTGSGDYATLPDSDNWAFGGGDFTIDCWVKFNSAPTGNMPFVSQWSNAADARRSFIFLYSNGNLALFTSSDGSNIDYFLRAWSPSANTWYHIAAVRTANSIKLFVNGAQLGSDGNISGPLHDSNKLLETGSFHDESQYFPGWLDEVRISKGIARWTSNFAASEYPYGQVAVSTSQKKIGTASAYFDGSGNYLSLSDSEDWNFGSGDFTIDFWVRFNSLNADSQTFCAQYLNASERWQISLSNLYGGPPTHRLNLYFITEGEVRASYTQTWSPSVNTWYHLAFIRNGAKGLIFIDGVLQPANEAVAFGTKDLDNIDTVLNIGESISGGGQFLSGYLDEFHISKGIARWVSNFMPSTEPYGSDNPIINSRLQDSLGEPCVGKAQSANYILNAGFIPTIQSNPPVLAQDIPYQTWILNGSKDNAFNLNDYFTSPDGNPLNFSVGGHSKIGVTIDPLTQMVSFTSPDNWSGVEELYFYAKDSENNIVQSNKTIVQVENTSGQNQPVIIDAQIEPSIIKEGDLIKLTLKARDLDNDNLTFTYSEFFTETTHWQEGDYQYSEATWQTALNDKGHYVIKVTVTDPTALSYSQDIIVNIGNNNQPPVLSPLADITANEGDLVLINAQATDPDNDPVYIYYPAPFDTQAKWLTGYDSSGTYNLQIIASDGIDTASAPIKIIINNTNRQPQAALTLSKYTVKPNEQFNIILSASDPDNDPMTFSIKKDNAQIASGNITGTYSIFTSIPDLGDHTITATVTDSAGLSATASKGIDVADPNAHRDSINPVMGDFNGDALSDLGLHNSDNGKWEICLSNRGVFENAVDWLSNFGTSKEWWPISGDFNADGKTDIGIYNPGNGELKVALSTGSGFSVSGTWLTFSAASYSWQPLTGNFNADKYTDFALYNKDTGEVRVALGTGSGFGSFTSWITGFGNDYIALAGDFNADALTDLCLFKKSSGEFKVAFSNSRAFVDGSNWLTGFAVDKDALISDFNNDGLTDVGYWDKNNGKWFYAISKGDRFSDKGVWLESFGGSQDESASTADFNGDGITDAACFDRDQLGIERWSTRISTKKPADLLTGIDNGIGGKTLVTYTYAASGNNPALPFPVYVASSISLENTYPADRASSYTQNFSFSGGYFDFAEREFRGFSKVVATDPITRNFTETYFYQGISGQSGALKGQIEKIIAFDGDNRKISQTQNTYEVKISGPQERFLGFPALVQQDTTVWEENNTSLATKSSSTFDNIGNLIEEVSDGNLAVTGDEKSTQTLYAMAYEGGFNRPLDVILKDSADNIISHKKFAYDELGNLIKDEAWLNNPITQSQSFIPTTYSYDSFGNLISTTDALGRAVTTEYETDFYAFPSKVTNSLGHAVTYEYEPKFAAVRSVTDPNGNTSSTTYDCLGRVVEVRNAYNQVVATYTYPNFNTKVTTKLNLTSTEYIDGLGRKYKAVSSGEDGSQPRAVSTETYFDNRGQTSAESLTHYVDEDPAQISYVRYEYDIRGRLKKTISDFPGSSADAEASVNYINPLYTETTDPLGHKKGTLKDIYGNIKEITEFITGGVYHTYYEYDAQNNLVKTTDNLGNITQIFYDSFGRKIKMIDADMGVWSYDYDDLGNLIKQIDGKGQVLEFSYDQLNRLINKTRDDGRGTRDEVNYIYDDDLKDNCIGRLSKITDQSGSTEFFYDKLGREIKSVKTVDSSEYIVVREYDSLDRLTKLTYPDGEAVNYTYDNNSGQLEGTQGDETYVQDITYNARGQIKVIKYGNGAETDYTYGQDLRLSQILTQCPSQTLQNLNYLFDKNGNVTTLTDNLRSNIRTYNYDSLNRLTEAHNIPSPAGGYTNFYYQYDSIGNMTYKSDIGTMSYGQGAGPHALTSAGGYTYQYDANGNMIVGKNKSMAYDTENRLVTVNYGLSTESYVYDGDGGRVQKTEVRGQITEKTTYIGSLYEITSQPDNETTITKHIFAGSQRVCSVTTDYGLPTTDYSYYHSDHLGSSSVITDASGQQVEHYEYTPYGTVSVQEVSRPSSQIRHKFTGKELDSTGLYFYGARYYDPEIGRFITADTIIQDPFNPQTFNRYSYCGNNPINYVDPSGHIFGFDDLIIAIIIGAVLGAASAAISGQPIWQGMLLGALGGALIGGGAALAAAKIGTSWAIVGAIAGGATSGAINGAVSGGNVGMSALIGGIGAGIGFGAGSLAGGNFWPGLGAAVLGGAASGAIGAAIMGGDAGQGTWMGAAFAAVGYTANRALNSASNNSEAKKQETQKNVQRIQEQLDAGYAEGGTEGLINNSSKLSTTATTPSLGKTLEYPLTTLGKMTLMVAGNLSKTTFPVARALARVGGAIFGGITLGTDIAQFYLPKPWFMRIHDAALVIGDMGSIACNFVPHPAARSAGRWLSTGFHAWDQFTQ